MKQSLSLRTRPGKVSVTSTCPGGKCRNLVFFDHSTSRTPEHYVTHAQTQLSTSRNRLTSTIYLAATWLSDVHGSEWGRAEGINLLTAGSGSKGTSSCTQFSCNYLDPKQPNSSKVCAVALSFDTLKVLSSKESIGEVASWLWRKFCESSALVLTPCPYGGCIYSGKGKPTRSSNRIGNEHNHYLTTCTYVGLQLI